MAQITLTHTGNGQSLTLEIVPGTLNLQDSAEDSAEVFQPRLRKGQGTQGACTVFLPVDEDPEITEKLLSFAADHGCGCLQISSDMIMTCNALLDLTLMADPPQAALVWKGQRED